MPLSPGADPAAVSSWPQLTGRPEMQAICRSLRAHNPQLVQQLQLLISELAHITLLSEDELSHVLHSLQADVGGRVNR